MLPLTHSDVHAASHGPSPRGEGGLAFGDRPGRVLLVSGDRPLRVLQGHLETLGGEVCTAHASLEVVKIVRAHAPDVVVLDLATRAPDGLSLIRSLRQDPVAHAIPIVALSSSDDLDARLSSLDAGASDCTAHPLHPAEVSARVRLALRRRTKEALLRRRISFLEELAASDPLTTLLNRRAFVDRLHLEMERATRDETPLSCLVLDIDGFKGINDRYGHQVGDDVLRQIARVLVGGRGDRDAVSRYGGEEFVWLLPWVRSDALLERAEWLRRAIEEMEIPTADGVCRPSVSIGACSYTFTEHGRASAHALLEQADAALLEAKRGGKNRVVFRDLLPPGPLAAYSPDPVRPKASPSADLSAHATAADPHPPRPGGSTEGETDWSVAWAQDGRIQQELRALLHRSVKVLIEALEARNPETVTHCRRVASMAVALAMELRLPPPEVERIKLASLIHDLGKLAVPEAILRKPGPLTSEEWRIVKTHPARGAVMLQDAIPFSHLIDLILCHQESFDGTGYPDGLAKDDIPLGARIIRVADTFEALVSDRPYRPRRTLEEAKAELRWNAGRSLDPVVVDALLRLLTRSPFELHTTLWNHDGHPAP